MAGYREFQTGEVLTAANVNDFLMEQSVMKFADAAARDTALGTAVGGANALREGMVAYLDSTDEVLAYNGTAWSALGNAGIGTNVVSTAKVDTFVGTGAITGLSVSITPTSATSKVLVMVQLSGYNNANNSQTIDLRRGGTDIFQSTGGSSNNGTFTYDANDFTASADVILNWSFVYLDSPATTSSVTYDVAVNNTFYVNRSVGGAYGATSSITAIEVAA